MKKIPPYLSRGLVFFGNKSISQTLKSKKRKKILHETKKKNDIVLQPEKSTTVERTHNICVEEIFL